MSPMKEVRVVGSKGMLPEAKPEQNQWKNSGNNGHLRSPQDNGGSDDSTGVLLEDLNAPRGTVVHFGPGARTHTVLTEGDSKGTCGKLYTKFWIISALVLFIISVILISTVLQLSGQQCDSSPQGIIFKYSPFSIT